MYHYTIIINQYSICFNNYFDLSFVGLEKSIYTITFTFNPTILKTSTAC
jgi:hypothetical protein